MTPECLQAWDQVFETPALVERLDSVWAEALTVVTELGFTPARCEAVRYLHGADEQRLDRRAELHARTDPKVGARMTLRLMGSARGQLHILVLHQRLEDDPASFGTLWDNWLCGTTEERVDHRYGMPQPNLSEQMRRSEMFDARHWSDVGRLLAQRLEIQLAP